ncbi:hypothetical protein AAE02nite_45430 [Adhaeribacter aerolatus]|uniref:Transporter n=2 Tax=Adhaeribacter aerolatus TaxID=670289 RepID=A0A512B4J4_9BACT|nr:hypothetical protein AAE02nite_45430 [Adhaeribacter aerolatus]
MGDFLGSAMQDPELEVLSKQINYLNKGQYRLAPVRSIEFRTQNSQLGSGEQQYEFRLNPANPWEIKYTNRVFRTQQMALSLEKELLFKALLEKRYQVVNDLLYLNELRDIREALIQNTENQITVLEKQKGSSFFDAEDFVELKLEQMEEQVDIASFNFQVEQKTKDMQQLYPTGNKTVPAWRYAEVISLPRLEKLVDSLLHTTLFSTRLAYRQEKVALADYEHALQKANINPGFIQTEYMPYRFSESKNPMGISMGVTIPLFNPNKADMAQKKLDVLEAETKLTLEKQQATDEVTNLLGALKNYLVQHQKLEQKIASYKQNETVSAVNALTNNNPLITLKFNGQLLKLRKIQVELKNEIYRTYIALLATSDLLNQKPLINFLSPSLQPL